MTKLGLFLTKRSVNKLEVARRTRISKTRITQLSNNAKTQLTTEEVYKIALFISIKPVIY
ncbi:MAG: Cro/C1-type DNA-binding domain protein [Mucilaginibacter sp.]|nr:Cro/C1-type DNA-binding domain protein [Mucilaginibacter sp.]